jgi:hypothetical protein
MAQLRAVREQQFLEHLSVSELSQPGSAGNVSDVPECDH